MNVLTVCVEYDDLLALSLPNNVRHYEQVVVVTAPHDLATRRLVDEFREIAPCPVHCHVTDAFYRHGAHFNKGLAIEEAFEAIDRQGWMAVVDADILLPNVFLRDEWRAGCLHVPRRRMCEQLWKYYPGRSWNDLPLSMEEEHAGYCQIFHADDPVLAERPWYGVGWKHAGGCDSDFQAKWPADRKIWLSSEVLHLGPDGTNWCGRATRRRDGGAPSQATLRETAMRQVRADRVRHGYEREKLAPGLIRELEEGFRQRKAEIARTKEIPNHELKISSP